jgi:hypothetical protein
MCQSNRKLKKSNFKNRKKDDAGSPGHMPMKEGLGDSPLDSADV